MSEIIQQFYSDLVKILPMDDAVFRSKLKSGGLLPGNLKSKIMSKQTEAEKAELFLDDGIKDDLPNFKKLLMVMNSWTGSMECKVKNLASQINERIESNAQPMKSGNIETHMLSWVQLAITLVL